MQCYNRFISSTWEKPEHVHQRSNIANHATTLEYAQMVQVVAHNKWHNTCFKPARALLLYAECTIQKTKFHSPNSTRVVELKEYGYSQHNWSYSKQRGTSLVSTGTTWKQINLTCNIIFWHLGVTNCSASNNNLFFFPFFFLFLLTFTRDNWQQFSDNRHKAESHPQSFISVLDRNFLS